MLINSAFFIAFSISLFSLYFAYLLYGNRQSSLYIPLICMVTGIFLWSGITALIELTQPTVYYFVVLSFIYLGISILMVGWLYFCLFATGHHSHVDRKWLGFHVMIGLSMWIATATNEYHYSIWNSFDTRTFASRQPLFWSYYVYCYFLYIIGIGVILEKYFTVHASQKKRFGIIALAGTIPIIVNVLCIFEILSCVNFDYTIIGLLFTLVLVWFAVSKIKLMDIECVSNTFLINSIMDGIIVVDSNYTILSINEPITKKFHVLSDDCIGLNAKYLIQNWSYIENSLSSENENSFVLNFTHDDESVSNFEIRSIPLMKDHEMNGYILMFKDITQLQEAYKNIEMLSKLIPICSSCKKIRDDQGYWNSLESYLSKHTNLEFSHGICDDCMSKLYPEIFDHNH